MEKLQNPVDQCRVVAQRPIRTFCRCQFLMLIYFLAQLCLMIWCFVRFMPHILKCQDLVGLQQQNFSSSSGRGNLTYHPNCLSDCDKQVHWVKAVSLFVWQSDPSALFTTPSGTSVLCSGTTDVTDPSSSRLNNMSRLWVLNQCGKLALQLVCFPSTSRTEPPF